METLRLAPELLGRQQWVSGKSHTNMNVLSHLQLCDDGSVMACFHDHSCMDVSELFPNTIIESYRSHKILVRG